MRTRRRLTVTLPHSRAFTADVGAGGFSAELVRVLQPGTPVTGVIQVDDRKVAFAGTVVWSKPGLPHLGLRGRMGIAFARVLSALDGLVATRPVAPGTREPDRCSGA